MSDDVLSVIPTDPYWQPTEEAAALAEDVWRRLIPNHDPAHIEPEIDVQWYERVELIACGGNLSRIGCPRCGRSIDTEWWAALVEERWDEGFDRLVVAVPCCGTDVSLNDLDYDWPCGFARFELEALNPNRGWLTPNELAGLSSVLGHEVRQIMSHI